MRLSLPNVPLTTPDPHIPSQTPSNVISKLANLNDQTQDSAPRRDDRLALIEDSEFGPYDHKAPFDDPYFECLEPNSGIRLSYVTVYPHFLQLTQPLFAPAPVSPRIPISKNI